MIKTIIGLIILLIPFLLVDKFEKKKLGVFYIFSFLLCFHLIVAMLTQAFGIFNYSVVLGINFLVAICVLIKTDFKKVFLGLKKIKIDYMLILIIIILSISLLSIHYNYTGDSTQFVRGEGGLFRNVVNVSNMKYTYPYFSDEWTAVSLIKYSIDSQSLPLVNPMWYDKPFSNLELPFHSFASEIILLLDLNPLTQYIMLSFFSGLIICLSVYFILRFNRIGKIISGVACLSVLYIVNGANLPGIWTFIPIIIGIISMLLGFLFMTINDKKMILFISFLVLIFYPPLFVLYGISFLFYFMFANIKKEKKINYISLFLIICFIVVAILSCFVLFSKDSFSKLISYIFSRIFYETFTRGAVPDFSIWKVIPIPVLFLSVIGFFMIFKKKLFGKIWLIAPVLMGLIYWALYSRVLWRFIIEYERVVVATSIFLIILSGFGLCHLVNWLKKSEIIKKYHVLGVFFILLFLVLFVSVFYYTERDNWKDLKLNVIGLENPIFPASPVNQYLHEDDLKLFENISEKRFLTMPWKGAVIGTATDNYPLETKSATLTVHKLSFDKFMNADCGRKQRFIEKFEIDYIYSSEFKCEGFGLIDISAEGFHLYEVIK